MQVILLEVYAIHATPEEIKLGKLTKKSPSFEEYVGKAVDKLKLDKSKVRHFSSTARKGKKEFFRSPRR